MISSKVVETNSEGDIENIELSVMACGTDFFISGLPISSFTVSEWEFIAEAVYSFTAGDGFIFISYFEGVC